MKPLLFLCVLLAFAKGYAQTDTTFLNYKAKADVLFEKGQYEWAKQLYEKAKQLPSGDSDGYIGAQLEACERCIGFLKSIEELSKDPNSQKALFFVYEKILDLNPNDSVAKRGIVQGHWQLAKQKYNQADFKAAAESFKKVIEYPDNAFFNDAKSMIDSCEYYTKRLTEGFIAPEVDSVATYVTGLKGIGSIISNNMQYPEAALSKKVTGKVWVSLTINEKGKVVPETVKVVRGIGSGCDEEAVRLVKMMNNWQPAYLKGRPVRFQTVMHISFNLN